METVSAIFAQVMEKSDLNLTTTLPHIRKIKLISLEQPSTAAIRMLLFSDRAAVLENALTTGRGEIVWLTRLCLCK
jgi:hypothetical protein